MRDIHRSLTVSLFIGIGIALAFFLGHRLDQDGAILAAFICGVAACFGCFWVRIKFW